MYPAKFIRRVTWLTFNACYSRLAARDSLFKHRSRSSTIGAFQGCHFPTITAVGRQTSRLTGTPIEREHAHSLYNSPPLQVVVRYFSNCDPTGVASDGWCGARGGVRGVQYLVGPTTAILPSFRLGGCWCFRRRRGRSGSAIGDVGGGVEGGGGVCRLGEAFSAFLVLKVV